MKLKTISLLLLAVSIPVFAVAHGIADQSSQKLKWNAMRTTFMPHDRQLPKGKANPDEYVVVLANRWALNQQIRACFYGGDIALRRRILSIGAEWFKYANLKFDAEQVRDCSPGDKSEIRIGFSEPGYWSYIGTDSINPKLLQNNLASMNFGGWDFQAIDDPRFTGVVLHEFGHALGFHHEHQSPGTDCSKEYDWPKVYKWYWDTFKWPKEMVDQNVRSLLRDVSAYEWSERDAKSNMVYTSNPQFLVKGKESKCNFTENYVLSKMDKEGAQYAYPAQGSAQQERIDELRLAIATTSNKAERKELVRQLADLERQKEMK